MSNGVRCQTLTTVDQREVVSLDLTRTTSRALEGVGFRLEERLHDGQKSTASLIELAMFTGLWPRPSQAISCVSMSSSSLGILPSYKIDFLALAASRQKSG